MDCRKLEEELRALREEVRGLPRAGGVDASALTVAEAAAYFRCSKTTIFRRLRGGDLQRAGGVGQETLVTRASVERLAASLAPAPRALPGRKPKAVPRRYDGRRDAELLARYERNLVIGG